MAKCKDAFGISAPIKLKYLRSNQIPSMNKKIILDRTRKRSRFLRTRSDGDKEAYNKQWNYCVSVIRKTKQDYYSNLDHWKISYNRSFLKSIKALFSDKNSNFNKITLVEEDSVLKKNDDIAGTFFDFSPVLFQR